MLLAFAISMPTLRDAETGYAGRYPGFYRIGNREHLHLEKKYFILRTMIRKLLIVYYKYEWFKRLHSKYN